MPGQKGDMLPLFSAIQGPFEGDDRNQLLLIVSSIIVITLALVLLPFLAKETIRLGSFGHDGVHVQVAECCPLSGRWLMSEHPARGLRCRRGLRCPRACV